jgi:hypothetical protein
MATFQAQVEGITGVSIGTVPTTAQLTQFLKDGVIDVTNKSIQANPMDAPKFTRRSAEQTSQGFDSGGAKILSVIRESGTDNDWRQCREVSPALQGRVVDTDSLEYASKFNPAYIIEDDGIINVYPVPGSNPDAYKVFYVNTEPIDGSGNSLAYDDSTLGSFPNDKVRLVVLYASIKTLGKKLAHSSMSAFIVSAVPPEAPSAPSLSTITVSATTAGSLGTVPTYTKPTIDNDVQSTITTLIDTEEDSELAQVKIGQFQASLGEYQADMQNELNEFNKEMSIYQTTVGEAMAELDIAGKKAQKDADLESQKEIQEYQLKLSRYQAEIGQYQAEVGTEVQDYAARYQWMSQQQGILMQEYMMAFAPTSKKEPNQ